MQRKRIQKVFHHQRFVRAADAGRKAARFEISASQQLRITVMRSLIDLNRILILITVLLVLAFSVQAQQSKKEQISLSSFEKGGSYGYADEKGKVIIEPQYELAYDFSEGFGLVKINNKFGFIDKTGQIIIEPKYSWAISFSEGLAPVANGCYPEKWGYIDKTGKLVLQFQYDYALKFADSLAAVKVGGLWGYIDKSGSMVISPRYNDMGDFSEGLAPVSIRGKWGYIDKAGKIVIALQFDGAESFINGTAKVGFEYDCDHCIDGLPPTTYLKTIKYIDKSGRYVEPPAK